MGRIVYSEVKSSRELRQELRQTAIISSSVLKRELAKAEYNESRKLRHRL